MYVRKQNNSFILLDLTNQEAKLIASLLDIGVKSVQLDSTVRLRLLDFINLINELSETNDVNTQGGN